MILKLLPALVVVLFLAAEDKDAAKKDLDKLQGTWVLAALEADGQEVPANKLQGAKLEIKGNKYIVTTRGVAQETTIVLDPTKKPKEIDQTFADGANKDKVHRGIYQIEGDTFKMCRSLKPEQERPKEFGTWPRTDMFIVTWKREVK